MGSCSNGLVLCALWLVHKAAGTFLRNRKRKDGTSAVGLMGGISSSRQLQHMLFIPIFTHELDEASPYNPARHWKTLVARAYFHIRL